MCPNDWEWGGLSWSINFDCLPNDYSSANNAAAACVCTGRNMIHEGFPLRATVWFSCCRTPTWDRYLPGVEGRGFPHKLVWLFICFSRASRPGVIVAAGVRQIRLQKQGGGLGVPSPGDLFFIVVLNIFNNLSCYNVLQCLLATY